MDISQSSGYKDFEWAIELNRRSLEVIGLWPNTDGIIKRRLGPDIRAGFAFIMIAFITGIPLVCALTRVWGDMILMIDNLRFTLPMLMILLKLVILRWKQPELSSIIKMVREDWITLKLDAERDVMIKRMRTTRLIIICEYTLLLLIVIVISILSCFGISSRQLTNLTDRNKPLFLQTYYFYDTDKSPQFELTYLSQVITLFLCVIIYTSTDGFFGFMILHMCGQLENFRSRLINLVTSKEFNKALSDNVMTHLRLIRYANNIEDIFTLIMFGSIIYFGIVFCLAGFVLIVMINNNEEINAMYFLRIYYTIAAIIVFFMQMLFYCYGGELIIEQGNAVYCAACNLEWYKWKSKQTKNLILLMMRAQKSFCITAGKIVPLTLITFCSLVKTSVGYISVLMAIQD